MSSPFPFFRSFVGVSGAIVALAVCSLALPGPTVLRAQDPSASSSAEWGDEVLLLSPFEITSQYDRGYATPSARQAGPRFGNATAATPTVPVTVIRRADAVVIEFALSNRTDREELRNQALTESVGLIAQAIKATPGLRFENREVQLASGDRRRFVIGKGGAVTSFANFAVFADLGGDARLYERVKQVRNLVAAAKLKGDTRVIDGPVALFLKRPAEHRAELLTKIFADLDAVKQGLGADFEVLASGLANAVQLRACSENEVELWIDYSFTIRSVRELEAKRAEKKS